MKQFILTSAFVFAFTFGNAFEKVTPIVKTSEMNTEIVKPKPRVYFWEVTTASGTASGSTTSRRLAKKSIKQMAVGTIISFKIIESFEQTTLVK